MNSINFAYPLLEKIKRLINVIDRFDFYHQIKEKRVKNRKIPFFTFSLLPDIYPEILCDLLFPIEY